MNRFFKLLFLLATMYFVVIMAVYAYAVPSRKGIILVTTTTEATTEESTEETTEEAKEEETEETEETTLIEKPAEITTVVSGFSLPPYDENGVAYTGKTLEAYNIAANTFKDKWTAVTAPVAAETTEYSDEVYSIKSKTFDFGSSKFVIKRYNFNTTVPSAETATASSDSTLKTDIERLNQSIEITGNTIELRYVQPDTNEWYMTANYENTIKQTLFIDTDTHHMIISVPGVYSNKFENSTLEYRPEYEDIITIVKTDTGYSLNFSFPKSADMIGEIWYLESSEPLANWNDSTHFATLKQDLAIERRFSWDGYYFRTPNNYVPYSDTMLYRHPSNYAGASFTRYGSFPASFDLGYVFTYTAMKNQNEKGYWATGPKSGWLAGDFSIGGNFYDTRFNTDFAENLLLAYKRYNNDEFLFALTKYAEYFIEHANKESYTTKNGGLLVQDYGYDMEHIDTHVSLNHQLAELNLLYKIYGVTRQEKYKDLADTMLKAIEDTQDQWVLANNNLNYAIYYVAGTNPMVDYPYLTYNDLLQTKALYKKIYGKENSVIEYLLSCKLDWMTANGVTGYNTIEIAESLI